MSSTKFGYCPGCNTNVYGTRGVTSTAFCTDCGSQLMECAEVPEEILVSEQAIKATISAMGNSAQGPYSKALDWRDKPVAKHEGRKDDSDKLPIHLLPTDALECIAEILQFGAAKYAPRNWEKGMSWSRVYRACIGHLWAWWRGHEADAETGKSHLWHAGCCILFLIAYEKRKVGSDDRPETERLSSR